MNAQAHARATFTRMEASTQDDWRKIGGEFAGFARTLPDRLMAHLKVLEGDYGGFPVDRYTHSLQTATRALRDGRDEEYVVCALLHDIGDLLGPRNHADVAAAILKPFVSEQNHWMVEKHAIFQGYYFFHYLGLDRNMRDQFRDQPWYGHTEEFCRLYDGPAFDPAFKHLPLEEFEPMVRRVFSTVKHSIYLPTQQLAAKSE